MICIDPETGEKNPNILISLMDLHRQKNTVAFSLFLIFIYINIKYIIFLL